MEKQPKYSTKPFSRGREILIITIDIGDGRTEDLRVYEEDEPEDLARAFCDKHKLGPKVFQVIQNQIEFNIEKLIEEETRAITPTVPKIETKPETTQARPATPSKTQSKPRSASARKPQISNYGEKLYYKGVKLKERSEVKKQVMRQQLFESEMQHNTFKPRINKKSQEKASVSFIEKAKEHSEHLEKLKGMRFAQEMENCTFKPQIDKRSSIIARKKASPDRHLHLYNDSKVRNQKINEKCNEILKEQCPFKPDTKLTEKQNEQISKEFSQKKNMPYYSRRTIEEYLEKSRIQQSQDLQTGQKLFHPKVGRGPRNRDTSPFTIGQHLYSQRSQTSSTQSKSPKSYTNKQSDFIIKKLKFSRIQEIFNMLGPDENGFITKETVASSSLPPTIQAIIDPLLEELVELNETLNFEEFFQSMELLIQTLTPGEKSILLMKKHERSSSSDKQVKSCCKSFTSSPEDSIYQRHLQIQQQKEAKLNQERQQQLKQEMESCTFRPKIKNFKTKPQEEDLLDLSSLVKGSILLNLK